MKILICGECPDPLTTIAQGLNRMRGEQMRSELLLLCGQAPAGLREIASLVEHDQPATTPAS
jgi:hypothetical protein